MTRKRRRKKKSIPPAGRRKKKKASTHGEAEASKKGKNSLPDNSIAATNSGG